MRIRIEYDTRYAYETPARAVAQVLRVTPRSFDSQYVANWRVDLDIDEVAPRGEDAFGNLTHTFFTNRPLSHLTITVSGEVETSDAQGVVSGVPELLPPEVFLRDTPLTRVDDALQDFASDVAVRGGPDRLTLLHELLSATHEAVTYEEEATDAATSASSAFAQGRGVCQDLSHIFIACADTSRCRPAMSRVIWLRSTATSSSRRATPGRKRWCPA